MSARTFKMITIDKDTSNTSETVETLGHQCECGNIVECSIDFGDRHWINCPCGKLTKVCEGIAPPNEVEVYSGPHECQDCGGLFPQDELDFIDDISLRIATGEPGPSGQCPDCGALCHPVKPEKPVAVGTTPEALALAEIRDLLFKDVDAEGKTVYHGAKTLDYRDAIDGVVKIVTDHCGDPETYRDAPKKKPFVLTQAMLDELDAKGLLDDDSGRLIKDSTLKWLVEKYANEHAGTQKKPPKST